MHQPVMSHLRMTQHCLEHRHMFQTVQVYLYCRQVCLYFRHFTNMMLYRQFYLTDHINREYGCRTLYENDTAYKPLIYHFDGYYLDLQNLQVKLTENVGKIIFRPCHKEGYALYRLSGS